MANSFATGFQRYCTEKAVDTQLGGDSAASAQQARSLSEGGAGHARGSSPVRAGAQGIVGAEALGAGVGVDIREPSGASTHPADILLTSTQTLGAKPALNMRQAASVTAVSSDFSLISTQTRSTNVVPEVSSRTASTSLHNGDAAWSDSHSAGTSAALGLSHASGVSAYPGDGAMSLSQQLSTNLALGVSQASGAGQTMSRDFATDNDVRRSLGSSATEVAPARDTPGLGDAAPRRHELELRTGHNEVAWHRGAASPSSSTFADTRLHSGWGAEIRALPPGARSPLGMMPGSVARSPLGSNARSPVGARTPVQRDIAGGSRARSPATDDAMGKWMNKILSERGVPAVEISPGPPTRAAPRSPLPAEPASASAVRAATSETPKGAGLSEPAGDLDV